MRLSLSTRGQPAVELPWWPGRTVKQGGPTSALDRLHIMIHGHLRFLCDQAGIAYGRDETMVALLKKLRQSHSKLENLGSRATDIETVLKASGSILDALNPVRNNASVAYPNDQLLGREALLVINVGRSVIAYLDGKLADTSLASAV